MAAPRTIAEVGLIDEQRAFLFWLPAFAKLTGRLEGFQSYAAKLGIFLSA